MEKGKVIYVEEPKVFIPDLPYVEGKMYRSKINGTVIKGCVYLGKIYFLNGVRLEEPIIEKPEDYELIDIVEQENI